MRVGPCFAGLTSNRWIVTKAQSLDLGVIKGASQSDFGLFGQHHVQHLLGVSGANGNYDLGIGALESLHEIGQQVNRDRMRGRDKKGAGSGRLQLMDCLRGQRGGVQQLFRKRAKDSARFGQG